jgi:hypothetical protein
MAVIIGAIWIGSLAWLAAIAIDTWGEYSPLWHNAATEDGF